MTATHDPMKEIISLHGLGFIQVQLQGNQRLHVWHPELPRRSCFEHSAIHNHRFDFTSQVLVGEQINIDYIPTDSGVSTHILYLHEGLRSAHGGRPWHRDGFVRMVESGRQTVKAGQAYHMRAYDYHRTEPGGDGKTATIMAKTYEGHTGAHSTCEIGVEPDADFDRFQLPPAELWRFVLDVLGGRQLAVISAAEFLTESAPCRGHSLPLKVEVPE